MRFQINLRGDLAKLDDRQLAKRLDEAWRAFEASTDAAKQRVWASWRGPIRHPWAYRLTSFAGLSGPGFSLYLGNGPFLKYGGMHTHLIACEIKDLYDEIQRRVEQRKAAAK
jgi:hypothetical protein